MFRVAVSTALFLVYEVWSASSLVPSNNTWDTTPVFFHSANKSGPFSASTLDYIAEHPFAMVTLEKSTMLNYPPLNSSGEAKVIQQARWIKQRAPSRAVLFYACSMGWNLAPDEGNYDLYTQLPDNLWLRNSHTGDYCTVRGKWKVFDLSQSEMVHRWLDAMIIKPLASGVIDGVFVDSANLKVGDGEWLSCDGGIPHDKAAKWNAAHAALFPAAQAIFGDKGIVMANNMDFPTPGGGLGNRGRFFEEFIGAFDGFNVRGDIHDMQAEAALGRFTEAHGSGPIPLGKRTPVNDPALIAQVALMCTFVCHRQ